eukprot:6236199-Prymnesium_polylepis.1
MKSEGAPTGKQPRAAPSPLASWSSETRGDGDTSGTSHGSGAIDARRRPLVITATVCKTPLASLPGGAERPPSTNLTDPAPTK